MESAGSASAAAVPAAAEAYDPMKDPKRRAKSNDPGWQYGYWTEIGNRDKVTCIRCGMVTAGGIKRLKEHLAGGYAEFVMCSNTTTEIRKEMIAYLEKNKRSRPIFLDDDIGLEDEQGQRQGQEEEDTNSNQSVVQPSSGTVAKRRRAAFQFRQPAATASIPKHIGKVASMLRRTPKQVVDDRRSSGSHQTSMEACTKPNADRDYVNEQWALWFYECGIPFNAINFRQFQIACEATAQYGSGYVPPSFHDLREPLLHACVKKTSNMRTEHEIAWSTYGCTLMSDGWTDRRGHHLINFLVNSPEGTFFMESVDASGEQHSADMLADLLEKRINQIGRDKVVQVVTDNGANYKAAGRLLMDRIPTLFWSPCATHCLDLMLEDIGKLKDFKKPIAQAKRVTTFIYRHGIILSAMRKKTGGMDLVRPAATRFATCFLTLKSLHKHRDALRAPFVSDAWNYNKLAKTEAGKGVCDIVLAKTFWSLVEDCLRASAPLLIVLRAVDGDEKPAMPEVAALMDVAKEKIRLSFPTQNKQGLLKKILNIIERRWVNQMDHPLYGAALYLNPGKFFPIQRKGDDRYVAELRSCFNDVLARMEPDKVIRSKIYEYAMHYEDQRGPIFSNKMALENIQSKSPLDWWRSYGGRAYELQRFAKRVVSLCASSSGCERNWSTFEFMHIKKRNRLLHKRLNDLVYVSYNRKMQSRFQKRRDQAGKSFDPLIIEDFNWDNKWIDSSVVHPDRDNEDIIDLTWDQVDVAIGASESLQGRNLPRQASQRQRSGLTYVRRPRMREGEEERGQEDEDENLELEPDPQDDLDMSEDDDASSGEEGREDNAPPIVDEFDDGY